MPGQPLRCLAVRVLKADEGQIDNIEFEAFMNDVAGRHMWISTTDWLFVEPPLEATDLRPSRSSSRKIWPSKLSSLT